MSLCTVVGNCGKASQAAGSAIKIPQDWLFQEYMGRLANLLVMPYHDQDKVPDKIRSQAEALRTLGYGLFREARNNLPKGLPSTIVEQFLSYSPMSASVHPSRNAMGLSTYNPLNINRV